MKLANNLRVRIFEGLGITKRILGLFFFLVCSAPFIGATTAAESSSIIQTNWIFALGSQSTLASPTIGPDGTIYVGTGQFASSPFRFKAVNPLGKQIWMNDLQVISTPAISPDGTIYVGTRDSKFYSLSSDGKGADGIPSLKLNTEVGRKYVIESSGDMVQWSRLEEFVTTNTAPIRATGSGQSAAFFRLGLVD